MLDRAVDADADLVGGAGEGGEVDVSGEVGGAGVGEGVGGAAAAEGLEGGGARRGGVAVVEDEGGARPVPEAVGEPGDEGGGGGAFLYQGGVGVGVGGGAGLVDECAFVGVAFGPDAVAAGELADGEGVEELVGQQDQGAGGELLDGVVPGRGGEAACLLGAEARGGLDEMQAEGLVEIGGDLGDGPEGVLHEGAAAGAAFDEEHRVGAAERMPDDGGPGAQEFAEDLGDLRRGGEVLEGVFFRVVGGVGAGHEVVEAFHRSCGSHPPPAPPVKGGGGSGQGRMDFTVSSLGRALAPSTYFPIGHDALAVLQAELADVGAQRGLVVLGAEHGAAEGGFRRWRRGRRSAIFSVSVAPDFRMPAAMALISA